MKNNKNNLQRNVNMADLVWLLNMKAEEQQELFQKLERTRHEKEELESKMNQEKLEMNQHSAAVIEQLKETIEEEKLEE